MMNIIRWVLQNAEMLQGSEQGKQRPKKAVRDDHVACEGNDSFDS